MTKDPNRLALGLIVVLPLLLLGPLRAQEGEQTTPPAAAAEPAAPEEAAAEDEEEVVLPEGESLSADNNLSFPVDI